MKRLPQFLALVVIVCAAVGATLAGADLRSADRIRAEVRQRQGAPEPQLGDWSTSSDELRGDRVELQVQRVSTQIDDGKRLTVLPDYFRLTDFKFDLGALRDCDPQFRDVRIESDGKFAAEDRHLGDRLRLQGEVLNPTTIRLEFRGPGRAESRCKGIAPEDALHPVG